MTRGDNPFETNQVIVASGSRWILNGLDFDFGGEDGIARGVAFWGYTESDGMRNCLLGLCHVGGPCDNGMPLTPECLPDWERDCRNLN